MTAAKIRAMLRDETDPPGLPPYITRSTRPPVRIAQSKPDTLLHQIMAKFEQGFAHNFGGKK